MAWRKKLELTEMKTCVIIPKWSKTEINFFPSDPKKCKQMQKNIEKFQTAQKCKKNAKYAKKQCEKGKNLVNRKMHQCEKIAIAIFYHALAAANTRM